MSRDLHRRLSRIEATTRPADWPDKPLREWTDAELHAVIDAGDPEYRQRLERMTDAELLAELERLGGA